MRRRTPRRAAEWGVRIALALAAALLGSVAVAQALANALAVGGRADLAHVLAPDNGRITALLAAQRLRTAAGARDRSRVDVLARLALRQDATAVDAVATLGTDAQIRGDTPAARRLFAYSQRLSRRNLQTQLWAIEDAVGRGDVVGAMRNYDVALRTSPVAPDLLFPVLAAAIGEPPVRRALVGALARRPNWAGGFVDYVAGNGPAPRATMLLLADLHRAGVPVGGGAQAGLIGSLLNARMIDDAWSYYALLHPGAERRTSRDPHFAGTDNPSPLDWTTATDASISASIQPGTRGGVLDFSVPATIGGTIASQAQLLPAGSYVLRGHAANLDQPEGSRPYWLLSCSDGRELGRVVMPNSAENGGRFAGRLAVPGGCPQQVLALVARASDLRQGVSGQVDLLDLRPAP